MDYQTLEKMTVIKLREEAKRFPDVKGVSGMKKEELISVLVEKLDIEIPQKKTKAAAAPRNKAQMKEMILDLRAEKDAARAGGESKKKVAILRKRIHTLRRQLRRMTQP